MKMDTTCVSHPSLHRQHVLQLSPRRRLSPSQSPPPMFGPIACISRGSSAGPIPAPLCSIMRAAIGTADTPAETDKRVNFVYCNVISFSHQHPGRPDTKGNHTQQQNAQRSGGCRNLSATSFAPTDSPRKMVTILISPFCTVSLRRSTTPPRIRLPKQNIPSSGAASGSSSHQHESKSPGKSDFSRLLPPRSCNYADFSAPSPWSALS